MEALRLLKTGLQKIMTPFQTRHLISTVMIPGLMGWACIFLLLLSPCVAGLFLWSTRLNIYSGFMGLLMMVIILPLVVGGIGLSVAMFMGYQWRLVGALQTQSVMMPGWNFEECRKSLKAGMHLVCYGLILFFFASLFVQFLGLITGYQAQAALIEAPVVGDFQQVSYIAASDDAYFGLFIRMFWMILLSMMLLTALMPFLLGPLFYSAQSPDIGTLLKNLGPAWKWSLQRYKKVELMATLGTMVIGTLLLTAAVVLSLTVVGVVFLPFLISGGLILMNSLFSASFASPPTSHS